MKNIKGYVNIKKDYELVKINIKGLEQKIEFLKNEKSILLDYEKELKNILIKIESGLKELTGIESELYYEIVVKGLNVTKAVEKVAFKYDMDISSIWKYYKNIKENINNLKNSSESPVV